MTWIERWGDLLDRSSRSVDRNRQRATALQRSGRVSDVRVSPGVVTARVQGSRATPYAPRLSAPPLPDAAWATVVDRLAGEVRHSARLLAGQVPEGFEEELSAAGVELFPDRMDSDCACGVDWCVHAVAVGQAFAEALVADPFLLLRLRGRGRERMLADLAAARRRDRGEAVDPGIPVEGLRPSGWTRARGDLGDITIEPGVPPPTPAAALKLLGDPPGWAGGVGVWELLRDLVRDGAAHARWWSGQATNREAYEDRDEPLP